MATTRICLETEGFQVMLGYVCVESDNWIGFTAAVITQGVRALIFQSPGSRTLEKLSPTYLAPEISFVEDSELRQ